MMDSSNLWEIGYLGLGVSVIVLLMVGILGVFLLILSSISVFVLIVFQGCSCFTIITLNKYVNIA